MQWCACGVQRSGCSSHSDYRLSGDCQPEHTTRTRQCAKLFSSNLLDGVLLPKLLLVGHPHVFGQCYVPLIQNTTWTLDACDAMLINRSLLLLVKHKGALFQNKTHNKTFAECFVGRSRWQSAISLQSLWQRWDAAALPLQAERSSL